MLSGGGGNKLSQSSAEGLGLEYLSSGDQTLKTPFAGAINQDYQKGSDEEEWNLTTSPLDGKHQIREMDHEVSYQHFNGGYGGYQPSKDTRAIAAPPKSSMTLANQNKLPSSTGPISVNAPNSFWDP